VIGDGLHGRIVEAPEGETGFPRPTIA
jgi:hypothetical protein